MSLIHSIAGVGSDYVERARHRVPMLNNVIEKVEPYVLPVAQVAELYLDAAFSGMSPEQPADMRLCERAGQESQCKLQRVASSPDLLQLKISETQDRGLLHRARVTGTKLLVRLEAFADNLGPSGASGDDGMGLVPLRRCHSDCSFSCSESLISSVEDDTYSATSEECLTAVEMIPRAIVLPLLIQMQIARIIMDKASSFALTTTAMGCSLLQRGALHCAAVAPRLCHRAACLVDGFLGYTPGIRRRVMILALTDKDASHDSKHSGAHHFSSGGSEGGTGCCTH